VVIRREKAAPADASSAQAGIAGGEEQPEPRRRHVGVRTVVTSTLAEAVTPMAYDPHDDLVAPRRIYMDNLAVVDPAIGPCELWQSIAYNTAKLRNALVHADDAAPSAGTLTEEQKPPPPVASLDAFVEEPKIARAQAQAAVAEQERRRAVEDEVKLQAILDSMVRLERRMDEHDERRRAAHRAKKALSDAEAASDPMAMCEDRAQPESGEAEEASPLVYH
jgi:hypothetical protein